MEASGPRFVFQIPAELEGGRYANILGVWHTPHEFTLDFSVTSPPQPPESEGGQAVVPANIVARIKVSPSLVFQLLQALNDNMSTYERAYGEIRQPGPPEGDQQ